MDGGSLVSIHRTCFLITLTLFPGNYDINKLHYDGPGDTPGQGYAYDIRVAGRSSANPPVAASA